MMHQRHFIPSTPTQDTGIFGQLEIGPIPSDSLGDVIAALCEYDISVARGSLGKVLLATEAQDGEVVSTIIVQGQGVLGYLVDHEGLEACVSDISSCLESCLPIGQIVRIAGHHTIDQAARVVTTIDISIEEGGAILSRRQHIHRKDVRVMEVSAS